MYPPDPYGARMQVNGDITIGDAVSQQDVVAGAERLKIIRGNVSALGSINSGEGFTVNHPMTGVYYINFIGPFSDIPTMTVTTAEIRTNATAACDPDGTRCIVTITDVDAYSLAELESWPFMFIAIGTR
jgi:hypothetical protein